MYNFCQGTIFGDLLCLSINVKHKQFGVSDKTEMCHLIIIIIIIIIIVIIK